MGFKTICEAYSIQESWNTTVIYFILIYFQNLWLILISRLLAYEERTKTPKREGMSTDYECCLDNIFCWETKGDFELKRRGLCTCCTSSLSLQIAFFVCVFKFLFLFRSFLMSCNLKLMN